MKTSGLVVLFILGFHISLYPCGTHSVSTQAELDLLSICTIMTGDLIIESGTASIDPITNLDNLENLISVRHLVIRNNPFLQDISGLMSLDTVRGRIEITNNPLLSECCVLNDLLTGGNIGGGIIMTGNSSAGNCNNGGSNITPCKIIPTLQTWGIIILFLLLAIFGSLTIKSFSHLQGPVRDYMAKRG